MITQNMTTIVEISTLVYLFFLARTAWCSTAATHCFSPNATNKKTNTIPCMNFEYDYESLGDGMDATWCMGANVQSKTNETRRLDWTHNCILKNYKHLCHKKLEITKEVIDFTKAAGLFLGTITNETRVNVCCCKTGIGNHTLG